jgi:hypothetical protein
VLVDQVSIGIAPSDLHGIGRPQPGVSTRLKIVTFRGTDELPISWIIDAKKTKNIGN